MALLPITMPSIRTSTELSSETKIAPLKAIKGFSFVLNVFTLLSTRLAKQVKFLFLTEEIRDEEVNLDFSGYHLICVAPIRARGNITIKAITIIALNSLSTATGEIRLQASQNMILNINKIKVPYKIKGIDFIQYEDTMIETFLNKVKTINESNRDYINCSIFYLLDIILESKKPMEGKVFSKMEYSTVFNFFQVIPKNETVHLVCNTIFFRTFESLFTSCR